VSGNLSLNDRFDLMLLVASYGVLAFLITSLVPNIFIYRNLLFILLSFLVGGPLLTIIMLKIFKQIVGQGYTRALRSFHCSKCRSRLFLKGKLERSSIAERLMTRGEEKASEVRSTHCEAWICVNPACSEHFSDGATSNAEGPSYSGPEKFEETEKIEKRRRKMVILAFEH